MATSNTGGWVRRVGSAGGGRTYRRRRPINFYGAVVVVVILGFSSVAWARYKYEHPVTAASSIAPTTSDTWYAALGLSACGKQFPALAANPTVAVTGYGSIAGGAIEVKPVSASVAGLNSNLSLFVDSYTGLTVTKSKFVVPLPEKAKKARSATYDTGTVCPKGTPDAGKTGSVKIAVWKNIESKTPHLYTSASAVRFASNLMLISIGFEPAGVTPPKPPALAISTMLSPPTTTTTTTTVPVSTTTGASTTTTTTVPVSTTTEATTTTTKH